MQRTTVSGTRTNARPRVSPSPIGGSRERRHQHPVHPLLRVLLSADRDHCRRLFSSRRASGPSTPSPPAGTSAIARSGRRQRARLPVRALAGLRAAREGPGAAGRALRADQREGRLLPDRPRAPIPGSPGTSCAASGCWSITAASRWPCSSSPATSVASTTPRSSRWTSPPGRWTRAFRKGEGDYIHQQGPAPQQLEHDKVGHVVASVGEAIGPRRLLEPGRHPRVAPAPTWPGASCAPTARRAPGCSARRPRRCAKIGGRVLPRDRSRRADRHHRLLPEARLLDARTSRSPARPSRSRSTSSSTRSSSPSATATTTASWPTTEG